MCAEVYLIHLERPYKHAKHYLGYTSLDSVDARLHRHKSGSGAKLLQVCNQASIDYTVVRTWQCDNWQSARKLERRLKAQHNAPRLCPICNRHKE